MKRSEEIYREILFESTEKKNNKMTQAYIAKALKISLSVVNLSLKPLIKMNSIKINKRSFEVIDRKKMLECLKNNFKGNEPLRQRCINRVSKYGNDVASVDEIGTEWVEYFAGLLKKFRNYRGGNYHLGLYTVSAHVPMGENVGATPDGRLSGTPLADGGLSPMYGRDTQGPTAVLNSVSRIPSHLASNGTLLNMKFLPSIFLSEYEREKFTLLLKSFISLPIHHVQFNVITNEELMKAKADPQSYKDLIIRVAGYTAYYIELASDLQDEIIKRTTHGE